MPPMRNYPGFTKAELQQHGVYAIVRRATGRRYIGETHWCFGGRWSEHLALLNRNAHHCKALQTDWNTYGSGAFSFLILDYAPLVRGLSRVHVQWRGYLERKRIAKTTLIYNSQILPVPSEPTYPNPYTPTE